MLDEGIATSNMTEHFDTTPVIGINSNMNISEINLSGSLDNTQEGFWPNTTPNIGPNAEFNIEEVINQNISVQNNDVASPLPNTLHAENLDGSLKDINILRKKHLANPFIGYLNINSLRGDKFPILKDVLLENPLDLICIDETKLTYDFPDSQFYIEGYQHPPYRRDRSNKLSCRGGGKIVYAKTGLITKRLTNYETPNAETICLELNITGRKWFIIYAYRPESIDRILFFEEISICLGKATKSYDYIILAGDLNVDMDIPKNDSKGLLSGLCENFGLSNLINKKTCTKKSEGSSLDVLLTNHNRCFQHTCVIETGISDHHKLIGSFLKSKFQKLPPKNVFYRDYKKFDETVFLDELAAINFVNLFELEKQDKYDILTNHVSALIDKHAPLKRIKVRGNNKLFLTKKLRGAIMNRSRLRTKYNKWQSRENYIAYRKAKRECDILTDEAKKQYFRDATANGTITNKDFWKIMKPALTNKGIISSDTIILEENGEQISDESKLVDIFNNHYINIVQSTTGNPPSALGDPSDPTKDRDTVKVIIDKFADHPIILKIRENKLLPNETFSLPAATKEEINKIMKNIDTTKSCGPDKIPPKFVKMSANILDATLANVINENVQKCTFSESAKHANVPPIFKKDDRSKKVNYRPVSLLNTFSKVLERWTNNKIEPFVNNILSKFISAYRKKYSSNHVLLRIIEEWKSNLDNKKFVGAVLMDLSKAFDCIPHDLLIAKLGAYGFELDTLVYFYSYLKRRKQSVKINNIFSNFQFLLSGVPQGSILGPILFNIFINDLILWIDASNLHNFADDNTLSASANSIRDLISTLENDSEIAIKWFKDNGMSVNPDKFHGIIINKCGRHSDTHKLNFAGFEITTEKVVNLLGIDIDYKLNFNNHIGTLCKKAAGQLNAICRMGKFIGENEKKVLIQSFVNSNFNYCPLVWFFTSPESLRKIERIQERSLRILYDDFHSTTKYLNVKAISTTFLVKQHKNLAIEIFKTLRDLNPEFMKDIFAQNWNPYQLRDNSRHESDLKAQKHKAFTYGECSLRVLGPNIWNALPIDMKNCVSLLHFKKLVKTWEGPRCSCKMCKALNPQLET